jgi:hypothetical protein
MASSLIGLLTPPETCTAFTQPPLPRNPHQLQLLENGQWAAASEWTESKIVGINKYTPLIECTSIIRGSYFPLGFSSILK